MEAIIHLSNIFKNKKSILCFTIGNRFRLLSIFYLFLLLLIIFSGCTSSEKEPSSPTQNSPFDFSEHDFSTNELIDLDGNWDFYWSELLSPKEIASGKYTAVSMKVPHNWNAQKNDAPVYPVYGFATYQARIKIAQHTHSLLLSTPF